MIEFLSSIIFDIREPFDLSDIREANYYDCSSSRASWLLLSVESRRAKGAFPATVEWIEHYQNTLEWIEVYQNTLEWIEVYQNTLGFY